MYAASAPKKKTGLIIGLIVLVVLLSVIGGLVWYFWDTIFPPPPSETPSPARAPAPRTPPTQAPSLTRTPPTQAPTIPPTQAPTRTPPTQTPTGPVPYSPPQQFFGPSPGPSGKGIGTFSIINSSISSFTISLDNNSSQMLPTDSITFSIDPVPTGGVAGVPTRWSQLNSSIITGQFTSGQLYTVTIGSGSLTMTKQFTPIATRVLGQFSVTGVTTSGFTINLTPGSGATGMQAGDNITINVTSGSTVLATRTVTWGQLLNPYTISTVLAPGTYNITLQYDSTTQATNTFTVIQKNLGTFTLTSTSSSSFTVNLTSGSSSGMQTSDTIQIYTNPATQTTEVQWGPGPFVVSGTYTQGQPYQVFIRLKSDTSIVSGPVSFTPAIILSGKTFSRTLNDATGTFLSSFTIVFTTSTSGTWNLQANRQAPTTGSVDYVFNPASTSFTRFDFNNWTASGTRSLATNQVSYSYLTGPESITFAAGSLFPSSSSDTLTKV